VELVAWTGHGMVLNSRALEAVGVSDTATDPLAGHRERDAAGRLTGLLEEYASYGTWLAREKPTDADVVAAFRARGEEAKAFGITSIQDMVLGVAPEMLARVADTLGLPYRLRLMPLPLTNPGGRVLEGWSALRSLPQANITVSGTKWILDGTPVERLALHRVAYEDRPGWYGRANFPVDTLRAMLREALETRTQPVLHAVGDSAIALVFSLMGELGPDSAWRRLRPRIEHGDGLGPDQFARARELGIVISQNPSHYTLGPMIRDRFGSRVATYQPQRSLLAAGILLALGSDGPINPFLNLMVAVAHPDNPYEAS
jgi:predicted amidohydrolase YtcJ